jgi:hypothetical protein
MVAKFYFKTHLQNTFFIFVESFRPRLALKLAKSVNIIQKLMHKCNIGINDTNIEFVPENLYVSTFC